MITDSMIEKAKQTAENAYAPYSKFRVGACIKTSDGNIYFGCNVENASYGLASCAEASAISQMVSHGEQSITEVAVISLDSPDFVTPCGACRQRIREFSTEETKIHMANKHGDYTTETLTNLLPKSFGPDFLENNND